MKDRRPFRPPRTCRRRSSMRSSRFFFFFVNRVGRVRRVTFFSALVAVFALATVRLPAFWSTILAAIFFTLLLVIFAAGSSATAHVVPRPPRPGQDACSRSLHPCCSWPPSSVPSSPRRRPWTPTPRTCWSDRNSGKALDVYNMATSDGARITQWTRNDQSQQQWQFVDSGGGYYRIKSRHSGKVLGMSQLVHRERRDRSSSGPTCSTPPTSNGDWPTARMAT